MPKISLRKRGVSGFASGEILYPITDYNFLLNVPSTFTPTAHSHPEYLETHQDISHLAPKANPTFTGRATIATDGGVDINAGNTALDFLRVRYNGADTYGWNFRYKGDESGDNNALEIHSSTARALRIQQSGIVKFDSTPQAGGQNLIKNDDLRLSDDRDPKAHNHTKSQITDFPTSMPASDVSAWAKESVKPSYVWSEIGSKPDLLGGTYNANTGQFLRGDGAWATPPDTNTWRGIVDTLTSTSTSSSLSANQGRVLKGLIDTINTLLTSDTTALDTLQEIVDYIETNKATLDTLGIANITGLQSALDGKMPTTHPANNHTSTHLYMANGDGFLWDDTNNIMYVRKDGTNYKIYDESHKPTPAEIGAMPSWDKDYDDLINKPTIPTNTWRPIDNTPVDGVVDQSISSNWAYDHEHSSDAHPGYLKDAEIALWAKQPSQPEPLAHNHIHSEITDFDAAVLALSPAGSRPASDVSAWAKESIKPSYNWDEIGSKPTGTNSDLNTSGSVVIDRIYLTDGIMSSHGTRNLDTIRGQHGSDMKFWVGTQAQYDGLTPSTDTIYLITD